MKCTGHGSELRQPAPPPPQPLWAVSCLGSPTVSQSKESACSSSVNPEVSRWSFLSFFFCIFILIISVCWWRVGHITTAPTWRPEDTFRKSQFSPSTLGFGDGIQVTRLVNKHRTILPASMDLYGARGLIYFWLQKHLCP